MPFGLPGHGFMKKLAGGVHKAVKKVGGAGKAAAMGKPKQAAKQLFGKKQKEA
jgi:hypothetical protein